jgi:glycine dehydrogenase subunit 2
MKLIFEKSAEGRGLSLLPECDVPAVSLKAPGRELPLNLPQVSENELCRHYTQLAERTFGVNNGFYPLGSCTMKYNPKINLDMSSLPEFADIHPLAPKNSVQGCLEALVLAERLLCEITGMDAMTFQPAAGAHGEFTGLLLIKACHQHRGDKKRTKILSPDSAHGTNPASASVAGFEVVNIASDENGCVDVEKLRQAAGDDTAGLMLTNPNTIGLFDPNILEITRIVHEAGGLNYYDGANLNAVMGIARPGDMGFDVVHLNLHKTFSTPHGGGGPGSGPVGCKDILKPFLPSPMPAKLDDGSFGFVTPERSIGPVKAFYGHFLVVLKALTYILSLGSEGITKAAQNAVLNANYMMHKLKPHYEMAYDSVCMHEFVMTLAREKREFGVTALDVAKTLLDFGIHPPTMYFPQIIPESLMVEPTETETRERMDEAIDAFVKIMEMAKSDGAKLKESPVTTVIGRPDEVAAARNPKLRYVFDQNRGQPK